MAAVLLAGCKSEKKRIAETAYGYVIATSNYQIDEAMQYASKETREYTLPFLKNFLLPQTDTNYLKASVPATATIDTVLIEGDTAWVGYTKSTPLGTKRGTLALIKEDGEWLVFMPPLPGLVKDNSTSATDTTIKTEQASEKANTEETIE